MINRHSSKTLAVTWEKVKWMLSLIPQRRKLLILTHANPDPDSIASAAALKKLVKELKGIDSIVAYDGIIGRSENKSMVKYLRLAMQPLAEIFPIKHKSIAVVDAQPSQGNLVLGHFIKPDIVIDHHPLQDRTSKLPFFDVRDDYGSTAAMMCEYFLAAGLEIPKNLATALLYGIKADTQDLGRETSKADVDAYSYLLPRANLPLLNKIENGRISEDYFIMLDRAIENMRVHDNVVVTSLNAILNPDMVPEIADLFLQMEKITWVLCMGQYQGRVFLSIRTTNLKADAGKIMKEILGKKGKGGGHRIMAGGTMPLKNPGDHKLIEAEITNRFLWCLNRADTQGISIFSCEKVESSIRKNGFEQHP
jgi:nanoRNase/pAp phosphatase (c-di-AMP/oligoRNAs hydrolase)